MYIYVCSMYIYIYICGLGGPHMGFPALNLLGPGPSSFGACRPICRQQNRSIPLVPERGNATCT